MRAARSFLLTLALASLPPFAAKAQTSGDDRRALREAAMEDELDEPLDKKRDFGFASPGKTNTRTAFNIAGKPTRDYEGRVIQGEMDVLVAESPKGKDDPLLVQRARNAGKGLAYVHVLEYDEPTGRHTLVFRDDVLWYAIFPTRAGETRAEEVARRYGDAPKMSTSRRKIEGAEHSARIHWFPESGVGFAQLDGKADYAYKLVFEPQGKRR